MVIICGFQIAQRLVFSGTFPWILNWAAKPRITFLFLTSGIAVNTNDQRGRPNAYRWPHYKTNCDGNRKYYCSGAESRRLKSNKHILVHLSGNSVVFPPTPNLQTADWLSPQLVFPTKETFQDSSEEKRRGKTETEYDTQMKWGSLNHSVWVSVVPLFLFELRKTETKHQTPVRL